MKKVVRQDGDRKVFIMEDGSELPFKGYEKKELAYQEIEAPKKKKKSYFKKDDIEDDNN